MAVGIQAILSNIRLKPFFLLGLSRMFAGQPFFFVSVDSPSPPDFISPIVSGRARETGWTADKGTRVPVPSRFLPA